MKPGMGGGWGEGSNQGPMDGSQPTLKNTCPAVYGFQSIYSIMAYVHVMNRLNVHVLYVCSLIEKLRNSH